VFESFYLYGELSEKYFEKSIDWFIKRYKYKIGSKKRNLCDIFNKIYERRSLQFLIKANNELKRIVDWWDTHEDKIKELDSVVIKIS